MLRRESGVAFAVDKSSLALLRHLCDAVFLSSIFVRSRTSFLDGSTNPKTVRVGADDMLRHYIQTWLFWDLVSLADLPLRLLARLSPLLQVLMQASTALRAALAPVLRPDSLAGACLPLVRIVRLVHVRSDMIALEREMNLHANLDGASRCGASPSSARPNRVFPCRLCPCWDPRRIGHVGLRIVNLALAVLLLAHFSGCAWFALAEVEGWPASSSKFLPPLEVRARSVAGQHCHAMLWGLSRLTGLGADMRGPPSTVAEELLLAATTVAGFGVLAGIVSQLTALIKPTSTHEQRFRDKMDRVNRFLEVRGVPERLRERVRSYYEATADRHGVDERVLADLPAYLLRETRLAVNLEVIAGTPLFARCSASFGLALTRRLTSTVCLAGDFLFAQGDVGEELYFLRGGRAEVLVAGLGRVAELGRGAIVGEGALVHRETRSASVRALSFLTLFALEKRDFDEVSAMFPDDLRAVTNLARRRRQASRVRVRGRLRTAGIAARSLRRFGSDRRSEGETRPDGAPCRAAAETAAAVCRPGFRLPGGAVGSCGGAEGRSPASPWPPRADAGRADDAPSAAGDVVEAGGERVLARPRVAPRPAARVEAEVRALSADESADGLDEPWDSAWDEAPGLKPVLARAETAERASIEGLDCEALSDRTLMRFDSPRMRRRSGKVPG
jgi:hyperpolarization activated cyclic nucleotide-gated potassium channel 2